MNITYKFHYYIGPTCMYKYATRQFDGSQTARAFARGLRLGGARSVTCHPKIAGVPYNKFALPVREKPKAKIKRKKVPLNIENWIRRLEDYGSTQDPIEYDGESTTPIDLSYRFSSLHLVKGMRIKYWGFRKRTPWGEKKLCFVDGTCEGMLRDRARFSLLQLSSSFLDFTVDG